MIVFKYFTDKINLFKDLVAAKATAEVTTLLCHFIVKQHDVLSSQRESKLFKTFPRGLSFLL